MSSRQCNQCGCTDIDTDQTRGVSVCTGCGSVLEDQIIVSEVQFQENSGGGSHVIGQFVSSDGPKAMSIGGSFPHGTQKESRTVTLQNGKKKIQHLASQLKLNQHCVDMAFNFFKMAVSCRMTRGRKTTHVIAACVYLVCRVEKTPHMLLDLSDALQVNVYSLGKTYLQLSKELCMNIPDIDPCLYIPRFAHALCFEEKTHEVSMTAMRLVQRMKRDWMSTGRRPSGLCGAALLVAARIHDFSRTVKEVIKVVKVCQSTLRKRLTEFEETPSSKLTIEEFQTIDLEEEHDPPSFTEGKRKAKKLQEQSRLPEYESQVSKLQEEIEETLQNQKPRGIWAAIAKMADDDSSQDSNQSRLSDYPYSTSTDSGPGNSTSDTNQTLNTSVENKHNFNTSLETSHVSIGTHEFDNNEEKKTTANTSIENSHTRYSKQSDITVDSNSIHESLTNSAIVDGIISGQDVSNSDKVSLIGNESCNPSLGLGVNDAIQKCLEDGSENSRDGLENCELDITGLDDEELDRFILTSTEVAVKTQIWMAENADYLEEQRLKEEKKAKEAEEEAKKPPEKRKKKITRKRKPPIQEGASAQEVIHRIIQEKKISCKINYDVLNDLKSEAAAVKNTPEKQKTVWPGNATDAHPSIVRLRKASVSLDFKPEPPIKKQKVDPVPILPLKEDLQTKPEIVVESGPVQFDQKDDLEEEEDVEDYYDEEDQHVSAAQLLGHTGVEDDYYDDMD